MECYETAERLAQYALATWPQIDASRQKTMLVPLVEAFNAVGAMELARDILEANSHALSSDDRLVTFARTLNGAPGRSPEEFVLPSGKLDAFSLSRTKTGEFDSIRTLYKARKRLFTLEPQNQLLLCNAELGRSAALFCKYLNRFLRRYDVGHATAVTFGDNLLENIQFHRGSAISGGPRVSIIMSAYDAEKTVGYAIRSILQQEYRNIEVLICDDGSTDGTMAAIMREAGGDDRVRIFASQCNQGTYNVRNALLALARGDHVTFHDADDFALPSRIRLQVSSLLAQKVRAVVARWVRVRPSGEFVFFKDQSALRNALVSIMAPRETFVRYGPYRSVRFGGDTELKERIRKTEGDRSIHQMKHPLLLGLWSEGSLTRIDGSEGLEDGYRGPARRRLAELTARQRLLGSHIVPEPEVVAAIAETGNILKPSPVTIVERN
ncbi:MAG: glycosyltransferase family A protein [Rhizomicrobium sp.]